VHANGSVENAVMFHFGPIIATFVGLVLYAVAFGLNIMSIRHDAITVETATSKRVEPLPQGVDTTRSSSIATSYQPERDVEGDPTQSLLSK
jgi:hypothetical protein